MNSRERDRRRRFGQNDLVDPRVIATVLDRVEESAPIAGSSLLEIGAGAGAFTRPLASRLPKKLIALDIDPDRLQAIGDLRGAGVELRQGDACDESVLAECLRALAPEPRIFGSLPYNSATAILDRLLMLGPCWLDAHVIVQKEVAQRLTARPGKEGYGYLSVTTSLRAATKRLLVIGPSAFRPRPKVSSTLVRLTPRALPGALDWARFTTYLSQAFGQRRKMLRNALPDGRAAAFLSALGLHPDARAEELSPESHAALFAQLDAPG